MQTPENSKVKENATVKKTLKITKQRMFKINYKFKLIFVKILYLNTLKI